MSGGLDAASLGWRALRRALFSCGPSCARVILRPMHLVKYLQKHIQKETLIETKDLGRIKGKIVCIDKHMNLTVEGATVEHGGGSRTVPRLTIRGSSVRSFYL